MATRKQERLRLRSFELGRDWVHDDRTVRRRARVQATGERAVVVFDPAAARTNRPAFADELAALRASRHAAIPQVFDAGTLDEGEASLLGLAHGTPFFAFRHPAVPALADVDEPPGRAGLERLATGGLRALDALHAAGWLHTALSPSRVHLAPEGVRLCDFAHVVPVGSDRRSTVRRSGAPELSTGALGPLTERVDLFGFGAVVYEYVAGVSPFTSGARSPRPMSPRFSVPREFFLWLSRMMAIDPADRFGSAAEALAAWPTSLGGGLDTVDSTSAWAAVGPDVDGGVAAAPAPSTSALPTVSARSGTGRSSG